MRNQEYINKEYINNEAEKKVLSKLAHNPDLIFDVEVFLKERDFYTAVAKNIFGAIKTLTEGMGLDKSQSIDPIILEEKIAVLFPEYYKSQAIQVKECISKILAEPSPSDKDFKELIRIVLNNSVKRRFIKQNEDLRKEIDNIDSPDKVVDKIECATLDFTTNLFRNVDIGILGHTFDNWLSNKYKEVKEGNVHIGIKFGFPNFEQAIGGGFRNGTVSIIAARAKMGKSFLALTIADHVARQGFPVLYLDTELNDEYQTIRRVSKMTKIPLYQLEAGQFFGNIQKEQLAKDAVQDLHKSKVYYVEIKGWSIEEQVSMIRRFFAKIVGKNKEGKFNKCLIILDYLKLMTASDKNADKEYEALGYRMTALHDLMSEYQNPMLAFAQQNREGLEKEDESTISGSDRIIWLCDNFTIFAKLDEAEIMVRQAGASQDPNARKPENCKIKVVVCRQGPGTSGRKFIGVYADIHDPSLRMDEVCGIVEERSIQTTIISK